MTSKRLIISIAICFSLFISCSEDSDSDDAGTQAGTSTAMGGATAPTGGTSASMGGTAASMGGTTASMGGTTASMGGTPDPMGGTPDPTGGTTAPVGGTNAPIAGGEPPQECGDIDLFGECAGTVLRYCAEEQLIEIDCAEGASLKRCRNECP